MIPLQDQCSPTPLSLIAQLFLSDCGDQFGPLGAYFDRFEEGPIGVASLAQVHKARVRESGEWVAVKVMHPDLE